MKFVGLILICASSCLALLLPAIGVVKLPRVNVSPPAGTLPIANPFAERPISSRQNEPAWQNSGTALQNLVLPSDTPASPLPNLSTTNDAKKSLQLGMGVWLLLGPAILLGLALWTFSPNPSGSKSKS